MKRKNLGGIALFGLVALSPLAVWGALCVLLGTSAPVLIVASGSMAPYAIKGDIIFLRGAGTPQIGSVIAFCSPRPGDDTLYVHRLIGIERQEDKLYLRTMGDAQGSPDSWLVPSTNVVGVVVAKVPLLGTIGMILGRFRLPMMLAAVGGYLSFVVVNRRRENAVEDG